MTSQYPEATIISDRKVYCDNANMFFAILTGDNSVERLYAVAAIINSSIFATLAKSIANPQQNGYYKFNKQFLDPVPFPKDCITNGGPKISRIARIAKNIEDIYNQIANNPAVRDNYIAALASLWQQLDDEAMALYGVSEKDKHLIQRRHDRGYDTI